MNDSATQDILELEVTDFGPIVEAGIDLRPLTVFIGPSNTGKSYLATLIYALYKFFEGEGWSRRVWRDRRRLRDGGTGKVPRSTFNLLTALAEQVLADKGELSSQEGIVLPSVIADLICSELARAHDHFGHEFGLYFGAEPGALIRKGANDAARVVFRSRALTSVDHRLTISGQAREFGTSIPEDTPIRIRGEDADYWTAYLRRGAVEMISASDREEEQPDPLSSAFLRGLSDFVRHQFFGLLSLPAHYLPAGRTGVMHARSSITSALIAKAAMPAAPLDAHDFMPMLSGILADFLECLVEPAAYRRSKAGEKHAARIEDAILRGSVRIERTEGIGYPRFTYRPKGWKNSLPLMKASSMVSELAPVVLYLRHMVEPGNVLIVEEPESHLHPAMQVEFTRQLAAVVKSGIRVIVTTHSEWVLEELANIVRRSQLPKAGQRGAIDDKVALRPDQVGAWLFKQKKRPKGSVVEEVKLDDGTGLYPTGFDEIAVDLHNEWADISSRIGAAE